MIPFVRFAILVLFIAGLFSIVPPAYAGGLRVPENLKLDQIECGSVSKNKAYAYFSWDTVEFATSYRFYSKVADGKDNYRAYDEITSNKYKMGFNPEFDFNVAVSAVNTFTGNPPSVSESDKSKEFYLSAKKLLILCIQESTNIEVPQNTPTPITPSPFQNTPPLPTSNGISQIEQSKSDDLTQAQLKIDELEKKLNTIEKKLTETQKKQSALEKLVNNLLKLVGRLFKI